MRRRSNQRTNTILLVIVLLLVGIGIAYAVLTEQLTINNTVSYDAMKWDVGFTAAEDGFEEILDYQIKSGKLDKSIALELLLLRINNE